MHERLLVEDVAPDDNVVAGSAVTMRELEIAHIRGVLSRVNGQIGEAARILGVHRNTLSRKLRLYGLSSTDRADSAGGAERTTPPPPGRPGNPFR